MTDLIRASDITSTMAKVKIISEQLAKLNTELANWKIYVAVELKPSIYDGHVLYISIAKGNKKGFVYEVTPASLAKYADDPETLVSILVDEVFEKLFKDQIRNEIGPYIVRAVANAAEKKNV